MIGLQHVKYTNAIVMPRYSMKFKKEKYLTGIYCKGIPITDALLFRHYKQIEFQAPYLEPLRQISDKAIFCGNLSNHFGHFILESLARIWYVKKNPKLKIIWTTNKKKYSHWQEEILDLLGIKNEPVFINVPTKISTLILPSPGYIIQTYFAKRQVLALGEISPQKTIQGKKLYISRAKLVNGGGGGYSNEKELEKLLMEKGWKIFHPQEHSIRTQLNELSSSEVVLGIEGSAFHLLIFFQRIKSKIFTIARRNGNNLNYQTIASAKSIDYHTIEASIINFKHFSQKQSYIDINLIKEILQRTNNLSNNFRSIQNFLNKDIVEGNHSLTIQKVKNSLINNSSLGDKLYYIIICFINQLIKKFSN